MSRTIVIAGASVAGARAAETLRAEGFDGRLVLVGAEQEPPYERPPLSKGFLQGTVSEDDFRLHDTNWYTEQGIDLRLGTRAVSLDITAKIIRLDTDEALNYDQLLIATGATPRRLAIPGSDLAGIHYLRSLADARAIRERLESAKGVVIVGMGFIGAEIAAVARQAGKQVVALEAGELPMLAALGHEVATRMAGIHRTHGVDLRLNDGVTALRGADHVTQVITASGATIDCDLVIVGIGVKPATTWLDGSGVQIERGVVVDEFCRTNVADIFAAGDVARAWHPGYGEYLLVEHFDNAGNQGAAAAKSMLGMGEPYAPLPYFWSDQYDLSLQFAGHNAGHDQVITRGTAESGSWSAFYLREGHFAAALSVNRFKDFSAARRLLRAGKDVSAEQLADELVELKTLLR
ncbi:MAG TPA: FAD-dependent oxidoreductase [Thermomicrobiales bacterium]|nr:FAD-dependent oxidoreductase [Thermomicrobiales bacterium]